MKVAKLVIKLILAILTIASIVLLCTGDDLYLTIGASILSVAALLWINYGIAAYFYNIANEKGFFEKRYLIMPFLLGVTGYLLVIALPDRNGKNNA